MSMAIVTLRWRSCDEIEKGGTRNTCRQSADGWRDGDRLFNGLKASHDYASNDSVSRFVGVYS